MLSNTDFYNRRKFIKLTTQLLLASGLSPSLVFASETNKILSGNFFIDGKQADTNFQDLDNTTIETKGEKSIIKFKDDFFLIRPDTKIEFASKKLLKVIQGSVHAVFGKRKDELTVEVPNGTIGIRGTSIFVDIEPKHNRTYFCNCYGKTALYNKEGNLLEDITSFGHESGALTSDGKFKRYGVNYLTNLYALRVPVGLVIGTSVPILKSRLLASKARQLLNRQRQFFQKKQVALLCNNMTYRSHDSSCFIIINIVRPTVFFAIGTEVPIAASRRNIPEFYRDRHRGADHKKWLGY